MGFDRFIFGRRIFIAILAFSAVLAPETSSAAGAAWTHFFFISGDYYYMGPVYQKNGRVKSKDQAWIAYERAAELARNDETNNYVIFFDPKGAGVPFSGNHVRLNVYRRGKRLSALGWSVKEVDSDRPETFRAVVHKAMAELGKDLDGLKSLYFYGEHISSSLPLSYDLSAPKSSFTLERFSEGLSYFQEIGGLDLLVMQACSTNTLSFFRSVQYVARSVVVPGKTLSNSSPTFDKVWSRSAGLEPRNIAAGLILATTGVPHYTYDFRFYQSEYMNLLGLVRAAENSVQASLFNEKFMSGGFKAVAKRVSEYSSDAIIQDLYEEALLPLPAYLSLLQQYGASEDTLAALDDFLARYPKYQQTYEIVHALAPPLAD